MKKKVLLVSPLHRNGGIASWTRKYVRAFPEIGFDLVTVASDPKRSTLGDVPFFERITSGLGAMRRIMKGVKTVVKKEHVDILHKTTSGSFGALTDWVLGRYCRNHGLKNIMHCRYGCIPEVLSGGGFIAWLTLNSMKHFDQIWVLDNRTYQFLKQRNDIKAEIVLTPNCIKVDKGLDIGPKKYTNVAFIANLYETKGILELIDAMKLAPDAMNLYIVGDGEEQTKQHIREHAGALLDGRIKMYGRLPNDEAVQFMQKMDIVALPTYYPFEAFPISILEAMSLGKLVISTKRAAIHDMLTGLDGKPCGIFVEEKSTNDIADALNWCFNNPTEADDMCKKAYEKVYSAYRTEVVYDLYASLYRKLLEK